MIYKFYVVTSRGLVEQLEAELREMGAGSVRRDGSGCRVRGPLEFAYRICLWSRCANRVLLVLQEITAASADELHQGIAGLAWEDHVTPQGTIAVDFTGRGAGVTHSGFGAQRVKDGIVDRFRERYGTRPSVDRDAPDLRVNVHARGKGYSIAIDLSGQSLHRRGYREAAGPAPLKETLAAGLVMFSGWDPTQDWLIDPMCGAGTVVIEAAMMAADIAPGTLIPSFGFERWLGHDTDAWDRLKADASTRAASAQRRGPPRLVGYDRDKAMVEVAQANAERAGVARWTRWETAEFGRVPRSKSSASGAKGHLVTNPPYGTRMGDKEESRQLLTQLGDGLRKSYRGWIASVIVPDDNSLSAVGVPATRTQSVDNGPIEGRFATFQATSSNTPTKSEDAEASGELAVANRMRKNLKSLRRWAQREGISCFRVYDADIPQYNAAVDVYGDFAHVQEYAAPDTVDPDVAAARLTAVTAAASEVLEISGSSVHVKVRRQQRGSSQYERHNHNERFVEVAEGGHRFLVNLSDYLDTGLFLDHRRTRALVQKQAQGARVLNLFCYTGSFSVYAAAGGASSSLSIDLSNTYLDWARRNFELNDIDLKHHRLLKADCLKWLQDATETFDLAVVDPPTFSNSKAMEGTLDIQRDHESLLRATMRRICEQGLTVFSTNARRFKLSDALRTDFRVEEMTDKTTPMDFKRGRPPHRCWYIRHRAT